MEISTVNFSWLGRSNLWFGLGNILNTDVSVFSIEPF